MFLSCGARRNHDNHRFVWHVLLSRTIFENYSNYMVPMWSCSVWIPQPNDLWEQQKICKSHANMQCFMRSCSALPPRAIFGNYSIFTYFHIVFFTFSCTTLILPAVFENCSPTELQCFQLFPCVLAQRCFFERSLGNTMILQYFLNLLDISFT